MKTELTNTWTEATISKETAKAYLVELSYDGPCGQSGFKTWIPKSAVTASHGCWLVIEGWNLDRKCTEVNDGFYGFIQSSETWALEPVVFAAKVKKAQSVKKNAVSVVTDSPERAAYLAERLAARYAMKVAVAAL